MKRAFQLMMALLLLSSLCFVTSGALADGNVTDIRFKVYGPDVLGVDKTATYSVTLIDPQNRGWEYKAYITAANTTGASPREPDAVTGNITAGNYTFTIDVTALTDPGTLTLVMNASSPAGALWYIDEYDIMVMEPVKIRATIFNSGNVKIYNATVDIYIDDEIISTDTIDSLDPGGTKDVSADWVSDDIEVGWHESRFEVDIDYDGVINPELGDIIITEKFFVKGGGFPVSVFIMTGILALLIGFILINRRMKSR